MPLRLHAQARIELRWWWEGSPEGEALRLRDVDAARSFVAALCARPDHKVALRRLLHQGAQGLWTAVDDGELVSRIAIALAAGRLQIARIPADRLSSWDEPREEETAPASVPAAVAAPPPAEEVCWPCLRAAASARALREASAGGAPFVGQD